MNMKYAFWSLVVVIAAVTLVICFAPTETTQMIISQIFIPACGVIEKLIEGIFTIALIILFLALLALFL